MATLNAAEDHVWQRGHSYEARDISWSKIMYEAMLTPLLYAPRSVDTGEWMSDMLDFLTCTDWTGMVPDTVGKTEVSRFAYDFFLSYFEDIDGQGHSFGSGSERYASAVTNKTAILREFFEKLGQIDDVDSRSDGGCWERPADGEGQRWRTVVMITSDHGHVEVGGHGGAAQGVRDIRK